MITPFAYSLFVNRAGYIFLGTSSGVYRSTDNGESWRRSSSGLPDETVYSLIENTRGHLFAAMGGVYRSTDDGEHWSLVGSGMANLSAIALAVNELDHIFAGTVGGGAFRSTNNGAEWTQISSGLKDSTIISLAVNSNGYLFAGTETGVFRSRESTIVTTVRELPGEAPESYVLEPNYPNPFNHFTTFRFTLPHRGPAVLSIYDLLGQNVAILISEDLAEGWHKIGWNSAGVPSGVYLCRLQVGGWSTTRKLTVVR